MAYGSTDKPAEMSTLELPGGALFPRLCGTALNVPAGFTSILRFLHRQEEECLPFNMHGNISPSLFKALHCLERDCQKLSHFLLRFSQSLTNPGKLFSIHGLSPVCLTQIFHELPAATVYLTVLPCVLGRRILRRTVQVRLGSNSLRLTRWHSHLHALATAIHETSGLALSYHIVVECEVFHRFSEGSLTDFTFLQK